jgi:hypothetical protein
MQYLRHWLFAALSNFPALIACGGEDEEDDDKGRVRRDGEVDDEAATDAPDSQVLARAIDDLIAEVCERGAECTGDTTPSCVAEGRDMTAELGTVCPELVIPFLECAAEAPTCDPEVDCADEGNALQGCGSDPVGSTPMGEAPGLDPATIQMACEVYAACEGQDVTECLEQYAAGAGELLRACPVAYGAYVECLAAMTGCDPEQECALELEELGRCGVSSPSEMP